MAEAKTVLYRSPGPRPGGRGRTYDYIAARGQAEIDLRLKEGWSSTLDEAYDRYDTKNVKKEEELPASMSPAEKSAAAQKALSDAAEGVLVAKRALDADTKTADAAQKELAEASARADKADAALIGAQAEANAANKARAEALSRAHAAEKARKSSALHHEAANSALDAAAARVLTADKLLDAATEKALEEAKAKEEAMKEAEKKAKGKPKVEPKPDPTPPTGVSEVDGESDEGEADPITGEPAAPTLEDVKAALVALKGATSAGKVTTLLKKFKVKSAPELDPKKYPEVIAAIDAAMPKDK